MRSLILVQTINLKINYVFISIRLVGGFLVSLICLFQTDLKVLIAYSSVAHIGIVISGLITLLY
jgi:NADH-ubiquinone oxidoreductase chain 4